MTADEAKAHVALCFRLAGARVLSGPQAPGHAAGPDLVVHDPGTDARGLSVRVVVGKRRRRAAALTVDGRHVPARADALAVVDPLTGSVALADPRTGSWGPAPRGAAASRVVG